MNLKALIFGVANFCASLHPSATGERCAAEEGSEMGSVSKGDVNCDCFREELKYIWCVPCELKGNLAGGKQREEGASPGANHCTLS